MSPAKQPTTEMPSTWSPILASGTALLAMLTALIAIAGLAVAPLKDNAFFPAIFLSACSCIMAGFCLVHWVRYFRQYVDAVVAARFQEFQAQVRAELTGQNRSSGIEGIAQA